MPRLPTDPARRRALARLGVAALALAALVGALSVTVGILAPSQLAARAQSAEPAAPALFVLIAAVSACVRFPGQVTAAAAGALFGVAAGVALTLAAATLGAALTFPRGTIATYANDGAVPFAPDVGTNMMLNTRYQFVLLYTVGWDRIANAADLNQAIDDGALRIGEQAGLPVHRFDLDDTAAAHDAVEGGAVGKVLITVSD
jgi:NADPH:quinone reductase